MIDSTNNSPTSQATPEPEGGSTIFDASVIESEASKFSISLTAEQLQTATPQELTDILFERLMDCRSIKERECLQIGDALVALKAKVSAHEYYARLREIRLTPVAAWDYATISQNELLRATIAESESDAEPDKLAVLAKLPDTALRPILPRYRHGPPKSYEFMCETIRQIREDVVIKAGTQFGWPRIWMWFQENWTVRILPTKMGTQGSFFTRIGLHGHRSDVTICPRVTDARLGGKPSSPCTLCDKAVKPDEIKEGHSEPVPYWAVFCTVSCIADDSERTLPYCHDPNEPFLLLLDEAALECVVSESLEEIEGDNYFSPVLLFLDGIDLWCSAVDDPDSLRAHPKWCERLSEPGELRAGSRHNKLKGVQPYMHPHA